jgi:hypothetical protein
MIDSFVKELEKDLGIEGAIANNFPGMYELLMGENLKIKISKLDEGIAFRCDLTECPKGNEEALFTELLTANLLGQTTRGCVIGLSEEGNVLTLSHVIDYHINYKEFKDLLEDFLNMAEFWQEEILNMASKF